MSARTTRAFMGRRAERGLAAVEFALVSTVFFMLLIGAVEFGRLQFYWNATVEGTRAAARTAVVCDKNAAAIASRIRSLVPAIPASGAINVSYLPDSCSATAAPLCQLVMIQVNAGAVVIPTAIPFVSFSSVTMPAFTTTLRIESMQSTPLGVANPACVSS